MTAFKPLPSSDRIRELLSYDPTTGEFRWLARVSQRTKPGHLAGSRDRSGYWRIKIDGTIFSAHRIAWLLVYGDDPGACDIDHRNLDKVDNRIDNLRLATDSPNKCNSGIYSNNTSGVKGVSWARRQKRWKGQVQIGRKRRYVGYFETIEEADKAVCEAREKLHGDFARHS